MLLRTAQTEDVDQAIGAFMVSFAFKNVVLFAMIILIVHVLLKNAIIERERTRLKYEEKFIGSGKPSPYVLPTAAERRKRAQTLSALDDAPPDSGRRKRRHAMSPHREDDEAEEERFENEDAWISPRLLQAARASSSSSPRMENGEEDMLRYVEEGEAGEGNNMITDVKATPHLTASFSAHKPPPRAANELGDDDTDVKPSPFTSLNAVPITRHTAKKTNNKRSVATAALSRENAMNGGRLFAEVDDEGDMGLKGANAFDTNYQTFGDEYGENEEDGNLIDADIEEEL